VARETLEVPVALVLEEERAGLLDVASHARLAPQVLAQLALGSTVGRMAARARDRGVERMAERQAELGRDLGMAVDAARPRSER
jgi:hypothetical protein